MIKIALSIIIVMLFGFVGVTYLALESGDVLEVETSSTEQTTPRVTHI